MAKQSISISISEELIWFIESYQHENRLRSRSEAVVELIAKSLKVKK